MVHRPETDTTPAEEARAFFALLGAEGGQCVRTRLSEVLQALDETGSYTMTPDELRFAITRAWRNSPRCIGRRYWRGMTILDQRHLTDPADMFEACVAHLHASFNGGRLRPTITVFAPHTPGQPAPRIWNPQLIRYAGYLQPDGTVIGDPANVTTTRRALELGWQGARGGRFDVLPLIIQAPGAAVPRLFDLPPDAVHEVEIAHPTLPWLADLGLRWHAVPAIADMMLDAGGLRYTAVPFSGWYMGTEIASRNFGDTDRYNLLPEIAERMGVDRRTDPLWRDRALLELNAAVLWSFQQAGVSIVDHHAASVDFMKFVEAETRDGRTPLAEWSWIVPPMSGSACPVFHHDFHNDVAWPNFFYQDR